MPILSVIVPSYNMEAYLPKCLGSLVVAPELMERLEVLVVNDGSKDRTSEIAHEFETRYPGVFRVIDKPNGNYGSCINAALHKVSGLYIKILDADDYLVTSEFSKLLRDLESVDADLIISDCCDVSPEAEVLRKNEYAFNTGEDLTVEDIPSDVTFLPIHAIMYSRRIFSGWQYRQLEGLSYTDCQWVSEPMLRVKTVKYLKYMLTCYLVGRDGQTVAPASQIKGLRQQMAVDMYLAGLYVKGKPDECAMGAWNYFQRLLFRELVKIYSVAVFGVQGVRPPIGIGFGFDAELKNKYRTLWDILPEQQMAKIRIAHTFNVNIVKIFRHKGIGWIGGMVLRFYNWCCFRVVGLMKLSSL